jgi:phospholipid/cholesterol/gamma-HCH transport system permease protein
MKTAPEGSPAIAIHSESIPTGTLIRLEGRLDSRTAGTVWRETARVLAKGPLGDVVVDAAGIEYCDINGLSFLMELRHRQESAGRGFEIRGLDEASRTLLNLFQPEKYRDREDEERPRDSFPVQVGRATMNMLEDLGNQVAFMGHLVVSFFRILVRRKRLRWGDTIQVIESAGVNALPIVCLIGLTLGVVTCFQSAASLRRFAAEIFAADAVVFAFFKEMGAFFAAISVAGRSGSAFAAELGTMKVNEEIDALKTMGLDPVPFLAIPRVIAGVIIMPILTMFCNLAGLIGGGLVFLSLGFPLVTYLNRILLRGNLSDLMIGLVKSLVFGFIIAAVGCLQGLRTGKGARAVGVSTTKSVVAGLILVVIADGLMGVAVFYLGL